MNVTEFMDVAVMLVGFALLLFNQNRSTKKDFKASVEEMAIYKGKTDKALQLIDENKATVNRLTELTERMALVLEEINRQRTINMSVEVKKTEAISLLLEHHHAESTKLDRAFEDFENARRKAEELRSVVA